jgi:hypothetical protein
MCLVRFWAIFSQTHLVTLNPIDGNTLIVQLLIEPFNRNTSETRLGEI